MVIMSFCSKCCVMGMKCYRLLLKTRLKTLLVFVLLLVVLALGMSWALFQRETEHDTSVRGAQWLSWTRLSSSCYVPWAPPSMRALDTHIKGMVSQRAGYKPRCSWAPRPSVVSNDTAVYLRHPYNPMHCCVSLPDRVDCSVIPPRGMEIIDEYGHGPNYVIVKCLPLRSPKSITFFPFIPWNGIHNVDTRDESKDISFSYRPSVLLLGFKAQSRTDFHREMPNFFRKLLNLGAQEVRGYSILGDDPFYNTVSFLTGLSAKEFGYTCSKGPTNIFDSCPFVWKEFKKRGYWTMKASDCPELDVFDGWNGGFLHKPTDYDFRPMAVHSEQIGSLLIHSDNGQCNVCAGEYGRLEMMLTYVEKFVRRFRNHSYWAMAWSHSLSPNDSEGADLLYSELLSNAEEEGLLKNTILIVVSDRGPNEHDARKTYEGQLEMRLPLLSILLPESFKERYPSETRALAENSQRIVSPFNLHETMLHLTKLLPQPEDLNSRLRRHTRVKRKNEDENLINQHTDELPHENTRNNTLFEKKMLHVPHRSYSLLRPVPENHLCYDTGIAKQWCACHRPQVVDEVNYQRVINEISNHLISFINEVLEPFSSVCEEMTEGAPLGLWRLVPSDMLRILPRKMVNRHAYSYVLQIGISSKSTRNVFMASLVHEWTDHGNRWYTNVESIEVIDKQQSRNCIDDVLLQKLCHCRKT